MTLRKRVVEWVKPGTLKADWELEAEAAAAAAK